MNSFIIRIPFLLIVSLIVSCASNTVVQDSNERQIVLRTPFCPISDCKLRYEGSSMIWEAKPPQSIYIENKDKDLFIACYADKGENDLVQSIIVKPGNNFIRHPIDCSVLDIDTAIGAEEERISASENNEDEIQNMQEEIPYGSTFIGKNVDGDDVYRTADDELFVLEKITEEEQSESETPDEINSTQLDSDNVNVEGVDQDFLYEPIEDTEDEKILKENVAQDLINQIESLYIQGLISEEVYIKEIELIKNISK